MKTTNYPEKSIPEQIEEMNRTTDRYFKRETRNLICAAGVGILIGIAMSWVGLCCYFYFLTH